MRCEEAIELISARLDGELSPDEARNLAEHLAQCGSCRAVEREFAALGDIIAKEVEVTPPPELMNSVMTNLPPRKKSKPVVQLYWKRWAASAAVIALVALAGWQLPEIMAPKSSDLTAPSDVPQQSQVSPEYAITEERAASAEAGTGSAFGASGAIAPASISPGDGQTEGLAADETSTADTSATIEGTVTGQADLSASSGQGNLSLSAPSSNQKMSRNTEAETAGADQTSQTAQASPYGFFSGRCAVNPGELDDLEGEEEESLPLTQSEEEQDLLVKAEDLEEITDVDQPQYFGVLTLTEAYVPQGLTGYVQENGDTWYYLNAGDFQALVNTLTQRSIDFFLEDSGQRVSHTQPYGLVIVTDN